MAESFQRRELVHRTQCINLFISPFCNVTTGYWSILVWLEFLTAAYSSSSLTVEHLSSVLRVPLFLSLCPPSFRSFPLFSVSLSLSVVPSFSPSAGFLLTYFLSLPLSVFLQISFSFLLLSPPLLPFLSLPAPLPLLISILVRIHIHHLP